MFMTKRMDMTGGAGGGNFVLFSSYIPGSSLTPHCFGSVLRRLKQSKEKIPPAGGRLHAGRNGNPQTQHIFTQTHPPSDNHKLNLTQRKLFSSCQTLVRDSSKITFRCLWFKYIGFMTCDVLQFPKSITSYTIL